MSSECQAGTDAKYYKATRKSPPYPANSCCGMTLKGNDDQMYTSVANKRGVCAWKLDAEATLAMPSKKPVKAKKVTKPSVPAKKTSPAKRATSTDARIKKMLQEDAKADKEQAQIEKWMELHKVPVGTPPISTSNFMFVVAQPIITVPGKHALNVSFVPTEQVVAKHMVPWFKEQMQSVAAYHKITLVSVWNVGTRICMMFENSKQAYHMDEFKDSIKHPDDDGNYPIKIAKREILVSSSLVSIYNTPPSFMDA